MTNTCPPRTSGIRTLRNVCMAEEVVHNIGNSRDNRRKSGRLARTPQQASPITAEGRATASLPLSLPIPPWTRTAAGLNRYLIGSLPSELPTLWHRKKSGLLRRRRNRFWCGFHQATDHSLQFRQSLPERSFEAAIVDFVAEKLTPVVDQL